MLSAVRAIRDWAAERPDDLAVVAPGLRQSVGELWEQALRLVGWLRSIGVPDDEPLGTATPPELSPAFLVAMLVRGGPSAAWVAGAAVGPDAPLRRVVSPQQLPGVPEEAWIRLDDDARAAMERLDPAGVAIASPAPDGLLRIQYSSGTTGSPKAISRTTAQLEARLALPRRGGLLDGTAATLTLGTSATSQSAFLSAMAERRPHLVLARLDAAPALLREHGIEALDGAPVQLAALLDAAREQAERLPRLRTIVSTGAPIAPALAAGLADWFDAVVYDAFGSSEAGMTAARRADEDDAPRGGSLVPGVEAEVVDDEHRPVPEGRPGRLRVRAPGMSTGYLGEVDTGPHKGFHDGWFYSGDLARLTGTELEILGRDDDVLNFGGPKVLAQTVEAAFARQPGVREAVAAAVLDERGDPRLAVALVGEGIENPAALGPRLARDFEGVVPVLVDVLAELPRNANGKLLREEAAALLQARLDARATGGIAPVRALRDWAAERPDEPAVVGVGYSWTARQLWEQALRLVGWLRSVGVPDDEPLGTDTPHSLEPVLFVAMLLRGGPAAVYHHDASVGPEAPLRRVVTAREPSPLPAELAIPFDAAAREQASRIDPASVEIASPHPDDLLRIVYSSGTTGAPKAIPRTAAQLEARAAVSPYQELVDAADASLMPFGSLKSQVAFLRSLLARRAHPLLRRDQPARSLELLREQGSALLSGSPDQLAELLAAARQSPRDYPGLRIVVSFGAPISETLAQGLAEAFGADVYDELGSNEAGTIALRRAAGRSPELQDMVFPPGVEAEIVDDEHRPLPAGEAGHLRVRVAGMASGYLQAADAGPHAGFHDGWFYSGDLARLAEGRLELLGRSDELLNIGGWKIMPRRVEEAAGRQPGVVEAVAAAVAGRAGEPQLAIAVVGEPAVDGAAIAGAVHAEIGGKRPALVARFEELPRTPTGKPLRAEVAALLQQRLDAPEPPAPAEAADAGDDNGGEILLPVRAVRDWAAERPGEPAVIGAGVELTVGELWDTALRIVGWLRGLGVPDEELVATLAPPSLEATFHLAMLARGGPSAVYSRGAPVGPDRLIQRVVAADPAADELAGVPEDRLIRFDAEALAALARIDPAAVRIGTPRPDDLVRVAFSSGSTGTPKAIPKTAAQLVARLARGSRAHLLDGPYATWLQGGAASGQATFLTAMIERRPHLVLADPKEALATLREQRIEVVDGSPAQLAGMLAVARALDEHLPWLRTIVATGAPIAAGQAKALSEWFGARVYDGFGSAETGFVASRRVDTGDEGPRGGDVVPGVEVEIVDDEHRPLPAGAPGRLRIRTADMPGAYAEPIDTGPLKGFIEGWFYTGDLARLVDGRLEILGRDDDLLNLGGTKIMPTRIEEIVLRNSGLREAVAAAVTDRLGRPQLALAVAGDPGDRLEGAAAELKQELGLEVALVLRLPELPKTPTGKPKRSEVQALLQQRMDAAPPARTAPRPAGPDPASGDAPSILSPIRALRDWAAERPDDPVILGSRITLTAAELWDQALRIAGWLRGRGVRREEAVGAAVPQSLQPSLLIALLVRGGTSATVTGNVQLGPDAPLQRIVTVKDLFWLPPEPQLRLDGNALAQLAEIDPASVEIAEYRPDEVVHLAFSSGTTGTPKAIIRTAAVLEARVSRSGRREVAAQAYATLQPGTAAGSQTHFLSALTQRRPFLVFGDPAKTPGLLREHGIEILEGSPHQLDQLLTDARRGGERLPRLRRINSTGAAIPPGLAAALIDWFGAEVFDQYGSTETGQIANRRITGADDGPRGGDVVEGVEVEIVDDEHRPLPAGEEGRLRVRTAGMAAGYLGDPGLGPHKGFHDGWFLPGDLGRLEDGRLVVLGRDDELMNVGGRKIMPQQIEEAVLRRPGIREAAAAVVVDRLGVRQLALAVVGDPEADLATRLRGPLEGMAPSIVVRMQQLPRTDTGKVKRDEVQEMLQRRLDAGTPLL